MIQEEKLSIDRLNYMDDISQLDCREDSKDPLGVQEFLNHAKVLNDTNITAVYLLRYDNRIIGYFTLSMFVIKAKKVHEKFDGLFNTYPALLLGQMCIDKRYRGAGFGRYIIRFSLGLTRDISKRVGCIGLILHTNEDKARYYQKLGFRLAKREKSDRMIWMYRLV